MELGEFKALVKMAFAQMEEGLASASASAQLAVPMPVTRESMLLEYDATSISSRQRLLASAVAVGALTGVAVSFFKLAIIRTAAALYGYDATHGWIGTSKRLGRAALLIPALGGLVVAAMRAASPRACDWMTTTAARAVRSSLSAANRRNSVSTSTMRRNAAR